MRRFLCVSMSSTMIACSSLAQAQDMGIQSQDTMAQGQGASAESETPAVTNAPNVPQKRNGLAISGGISLGVYEAGLNWVILKRLRKSLLDGNASADIAGVTGASAGNINAFIFATEWCVNDKEHMKSDVKNNWFWRSWVNIGLSQLFPYSSSNPEEFSERLVLENTTYEPTHDCGQDQDTPGKLKHGKCEGLLSRRAFIPIFEAFKTTWSKVNLFRPCRLPVGVTLTSAPTYSLDKNLGIQGQRYVAPLTVCSSAETGLSFRLYQGGGTADCQNSVAEPFGRGGVDASTRNALSSSAAKSVLGSLGDRERVFWPYTDKNKEVEYDIIADVIRASSAFPVAFAPVAIQGVERISNKDKSFGRINFDSDEPLENTYFMDGGIYDNVPLSLLKAFYKDGGFSYDSIYYMDPDTRRGDAQTWFDTSTATSNFLRGISSLASLANYFLATGRTYELQTLLRNDVSEISGKVAKTNRFFPLYGEAFIAFGAFLARPFREYDYYVGVYDGIKQAAALSKSSFEQVSEEVLGTGDANKNNAFAREITGKLYECEEALKNNDKFAEKCLENFKLKTNPDRFKEAFDQEEASGCVANVSNNASTCSTLFKGVDPEDAVRLVARSQLKAMLNLQKMHSSLKGNANPTKEAEFKNAQSNVFDDVLKDIKKQEKEASLTFWAHAYSIRKTSGGVESDTIFTQNGKNEIPYHHLVVKDEVSFLSDPKGWLEYIGVDMLLRLREFLPSNGQTDRDKLYDRLITAGEFYFYGRSSLVALTSYREGVDWNVHSIPEYSGFGNSLFRGLAVFIPDLFFYFNGSAYLSLNWDLFRIRGEKWSWGVVQPNYEASLGGKHGLGASTDLIWNCAPGIFGIGPVAEGSLMFDTWSDLHSERLMRTGFLGRVVLLDKLMLDIGYQGFFYGAQGSDRPGWSIDHDVVIRLGVRDVASLGYWITRFFTYDGRSGEK